MMLLLPSEDAEQQRMRRVHMARAMIDAGQPRRIDALGDALPAGRGTANIVPDAVFCRASFGNEDGQPQSDSRADKGARSNRSHRTD